MLVYASEELLTLKSLRDLGEDESASIHPASLNKVSPNRNVIQMRDTPYLVLHPNKQRLTEDKTLLNWTVVRFRTKRDGYRIVQSGLQHEALHPVGQNAPECPSVGKQKKSDLKARK